MKSDSEMQKAAQFKFGLIAPVIQDTYPDESISAYCRRVSEKPVVLPDGRVLQYKAKTLEKWISSYRRCGIDALTYRRRKDLGSTRVIPVSAEEEIYRLKKEYPRLNATQIRERLIEEGCLPSNVSLSSVQRYIKRNGLRGAALVSMKDRKAFEETYFGAMWQADTCYLPCLNEGGKKRRCYLIMILDDHSRMIVGGQIFYQDNAYNLQTVLHNAVETYGIPNKLYCDNGAPYRNDQLAMICSSIGTVLLHTAVRDGASKGKVERNFRTMKERWLYGLDFAQIGSLKELNDLMSEYTRRHNTTVHSVTKEAPLTRYTKTNDRVRKPKSREWLDECFCNRITRNVRRDSTVIIDTVMYDVPFEFIGQKVEIRYLPQKMDMAYILNNGKRYDLKKTNKNENARTKRQNAMTIDYSRTGKGEINV